MVSGEVNMTAAAAASCDPDYGWINGPEGSNKCYMVLRVGPGSIDVTPPCLQDQAFAACFPGGGGGYPDWSCDPSNPNCNFECYNRSS